MGHLGTNPIHSTACFDTVPVPGLTAISPVSLDLLPVVWARQPPLSGDLQLGQEPTGQVEAEGSLWSYPSQAGSFWEGAKGDLFRSLVARTLSGP